MAGPDGQLSRTGGGGDRRLAVALVAHDAKKAEMADFAAAHEAMLARFELYATGTTGARVMERCPWLSVTRLKSGPLGGDQQVGALIAEGRIGALIFFVDPLSPHPHDVDVKALTRLALVYDIPMALNRATAERLIGTLAP
jgi:methylglyoxal synthase